jgi:hypothetical protein
MRRLIATMATLACCVAFTAVPAQTASADTVTVGQSGWSVALTFPSMQWSSFACQFLPVSAVVTGADVQSWTFGGFVNGVDSDGDYDYTWFIDYDDMVSDGPGSFSFRHAVMMCPSYDWTGTYDVVGEVGVRLAGGTEWTWLPYRAAFDLTGIPTSTVLDSIDVAGGVATFSGRSTVIQQVPASFTGCRTSVSIETVMGDGWEGIGGGELAADGTFSVEVPTFSLTGSQYRVRSEESICASSTSDPRELPVRLPIARVGSVSNNSKLRVDIDPNLGRRSWAFKVQRQTQDGGWRTVRSLRTRGSQETRTINLRKGSYRVRVPAQRGYAETYSDVIWIER